MNIKNFIKKNWSNILFVLALGLILYPPTGKPIRVFVHQLVAGSPKELKESKQEKLAAYDWNLIQESGTPIDFNQSKGKVVLVNLWATWCPPCVAEMPSLQSLYDDYQDKMDFYFVSNEDFAKTNAFKAKKNMDIPVVRPASAHPEQLASTSIPATYLIDKQGNILVRKIGAADWNSESFRKILDELIGAE